MPLLNVVVRVGIYEILNYISFLYFRLSYKMPSNLGTPEIQKSHLNTLESKVSLRRFGNASTCAIPIEQIEALQALAIDSINVSPSRRKAKQKNQNNDDDPYRRPSVMKTATEVFSGSDFISKDNALRSEIFKIMIKFLA